MKTDNNNQRGSWGSRFGFILAASGSAIGLGNIWKFPYIVGENGGGAFVLIYLICIFIIGTPIIFIIAITITTTTTTTRGVFQNTTICHQN